MNQNCIAVVSIFLAVTLLVVGANGSVKAVMPATSVTLNGPDDGEITTDHTPTFDWGDVATALEYQVHVSKSPDFDAILFTQHVTSSEFTPTISINAGVYYWYVTVVESGGNTDSAVNRFVIADTHLMDGFEAGNYTTWENLGDRECLFQGNGTNECIFNTTTVHSGTYSMELKIDDTNGDTQAAYAAYYDLPSGAGYYSAWYYIPSNIVTGDSNPTYEWWNLMQWKSTYDQNSDNSRPVFGLDAGSGDELTLVHLPDNLDNDRVIFPQSGTPVSLPKNQWFHLEVYYERDVTAGHVVVWQDGVKLFDVDDYPTVLSDQTLYFLLNHYADKISPDVSSIYIDEISVYSMATNPIFWSSEFGYNNGVSPSWEDPDTPRKVADVNGDGINDLIGFASSGVQVALGTGYGFSSSTQWIADFGSSGGWGGANTIRTMADVNGDGKSDIVGFGNYGVVVSLSTGTSFSTPGYWIYGYGSDPSAGGWSTTENNRVVADVNGDGKADVVGYGDYGVQVSLSTGSSFDTAQYWVMGYGADVSAGNWDGIQNPRTIADLNGDGCGDVVGFADYGVLVSLSDACSASPTNTFGTAAYWVYGYAYLLGDWDSTEHVRTFSDVDNDGDDDLIGFGDTGVLVALSNGSNAFSDANYWIMGYGYVSGGWDVDQHPRMVADVNGDGFGDVVGFANDGVLVSLSDGNLFE